VKIVFVGFMQNSFW